MLAEHSLVVLNRDIAEQGLHIGDVGAVVAIYSEGAAYEVEFVAGNGSTVALVTLESKDVRAMQGGELLHARQRD